MEKSRDRRVEVRGTTQDVVRQHNMATLLGHIHRRGSTSRAELTRILGLNRSTIAALVDDLATRGLVVERITRERGTPGRPSHLVAIRTDTIAALAVVLGVDAVTVAVVAPGGHVLERTEIGLDRERDRTLERVLRTVCGVIKKMAARLPPGLRLAGMGVAVPGVVRAEDGVVHFAPNLGWREVPFGARMATRLRSQVGLSIPVLCRNDASLGAVAEHIRGIGSSVANLVYIHAEVGVGGGIIADGKLLDGAAGYAGEIGHIRVNPDGAPCRCGSRGCWETETGEDALVTLAGRRPGGRAAVDEVLAAAAGGEPDAKRALQRVAWWVGIGLANIVNIFNPDMVVLGGLLADVLELERAALTAQMRAGVVTEAQLDVEIVPPSLGRESVLLGAAEIALEPVLLDPGRIPAVIRPELRRSLPGEPLLSEEGA
jgi:predicted NBD/HSP70 family sugar kinase